MIPIEPTNVDTITNKLTKKPLLLKDIDFEENNYNMINNITFIYLKYISHILSCCVLSIETDILPTFRKILFKDNYNCNFYFVTENGEKILKELKVYSRYAETKLTHIESATFDTKTLALKSINPFKNINYSSNTFTNSWGFTSLSIPEGDFEVFESIEGTCVTITFDSDNEHFSVSTKTSGDASNYWDSKISFREQTLNTFKEMGINLDTIQEIMKQEENTHYTLVINLINTSKDSSFSNVNMNTMISALLINKRKNPYEKVKVVVEDYLSQLKVDKKYFNEEQMVSIQQNIKTCCESYVKILNTEQFQAFLFNNKIGTFPIPNRFTVTDFNDIIDTCKNLPFDKKGYILRTNDNINISINGEEYSYAVSLRQTPNKSIHINGDITDENFALNNYNLFLLWISYIKALHDDELKHRFPDIVINVRTDFYKFYGDKFKNIFKLFNRYFESYIVLLKKYYQGRYLSEVMHIEHYPDSSFPKCVFYNNENKNMIRDIHQHFVKKRYTEGNKSFVIDDKYLRDEYMLDNVFNKFYEDSQSYDYNELDYKGYYGNVFYNIFKRDMDTTVKSKCGKLYKCKVFDEFLF